MKLANLSATLLVAVTCMTAYIPAYAGEVQHSESQTQSVQPITPASTPTRTIPAATAIAIVFPSDLILNADTEQTTTLLLIQPIFDEAGNEIAPKNSLVSARLKPSKGGITVTADFLVVRGKTVPIQASTVVIPGQTVTLQSGVEHAREASQIGGRLAGTIIGATNAEDVDGIKRGALAGTGIGLMFGLLSPKKATVVKILQGSVYVLTLLSDASLP